MFGGWDDGGGAVRGWGRVVSCRRGAVGGGRAVDGRDCCKGPVDGSDAGLFVESVSGG